MLLYLDPAIIIPSDQLEALLSQSKQDRPEVRAKSSIGLVAFVIAKAAGTNDKDDDDIDQLDACIAIARGLGDEWPLVREAFQEQLVAGFEKSDDLRTHIGQDELLDRIVSRSQETVKLASERLAAAAGILALVGITHGDNEQGPLCQNWNDGRVDTILIMAFKGWATKQETPQATRFIELLTKSFSDFQLVRSLGYITTTSFAQSAQVTPFVRYATTVLRSLTLDTTKTPTSASAALQVRDWALAIWVCDKLRIPRRVFATRSHLEESPDNIRIATLFAESAPILLECLGQILRIQTVDNTYTLHRIIMACAAFTDPKDVWNQRYPSVSKATITQAEQNLAAIIEHTHWSVKSSSSTTTPSTSGAFPDDTKISDPNSSGSRDHHSRNAIMIPGSFSDHVIQILEKDIRPCFANIQAHKVAQRAQATIEMHQDTLRQQKQQLIASVEESSSSKEDGTVSSTGDSTGKDVARRDQHPNRTNATRFKIAPVGDTPNDEDEFWTRMDNRSEGEDNYDPTLPKRWDVDFLESVPIAEWCARQPIEDSSRILEVFMLLVGPILAMAESVDFRYRVRGLDLLSRFLLRYHGSDINTNTGKGMTRAALESQRIWIRIFERTGLDQVLERTLTPLLAPIQAMFSPAPGAEDYHPGTDESGFSLGVLTAAFEAYLTLILVNTEPADKPTSEIDDSTRIPLSQQSGITSTTALTVENLFLHGILGSFKRASPSKEYRTVILEWLARLVRPVVSLDLLVVHEKEESSLSHQIGFQGIFGMGSLTIKYLPTLIPYLCGILEVPLPSSPPDVRLESLTLAWRTSEALYHVMDVSHARIPRHRGQLLATICKCWANSRIFSVTSTSSSSTSVDRTIKTNLEQEQTRLDESLVRTMRRCIEICQPKITTSTTDDQSAASGLDKDLKILKELDPAVFGPLFVS